MIGFTKKIVPSFLPGLLMLMAPSCTEPGPSVTDDGSTGQDDAATTTDPSSATADETGIVDTESSDSGIEPGCGNGIVDADETCDDEGESPTCDDDCTAAVCGDMNPNAAAGEDCDGIDLAGATCQTQGFSDGVLTCGGGCSYDTSGCAGPLLVLSFSPIKQFDFSWAAAAGAEYYRLEESIAPGEPFVPVGGDIVGESISLTRPLHLRYEASYRLSVCNAEECYVSDVVEVMSSMAEAVGYVKASNTAMHDYFGGSVALSDDGSTLVVGAPSEDSSATGIDGNQANNSAQNSGAVYVFVRDGMGAWSQQAYIKASNPGESDWFGRNVALSGDGNILAVGADHENSNATGIDGNQVNNLADEAGAVYMFVRSGAGVWSQEAYIKASNTGEGDWFGRSVALSEDGSVLAVGAIYEDSNATGIDGDQTNDAAPDSGAVYVFVRGGGGTWSQAAYVKASNPGSGDGFGETVMLSGDGNILAVVATYEDSNATGIDGDQANDSAPDSGAAYVFVRDGVGAWSQEAYIKASNTGAGDWFGYGGALSEDGNTLVVGAMWEDSNATGIDGDQGNDSALDSGAAYVLVRDDEGVWSQEAYVKASNADPEDWFGYSVSLSEDGNTLAVTAGQEASSATGINGDQDDDSIPRAGAVYLLVRDGTGVWSQQTYVKASNADASDYFGAKIALSGDGNTLAVGALNEESNATGIGGDQANDAAPDSGAVYLY